MLAHGWHSPILRPRRATLARLFPIVASLALAACGDAVEPLTPSESPAESHDPADTAAATLAPADVLTAALTSPRIVFASYRTGNQMDLYLMGPQGGNVVRLTSFSGDENYPAWSWDNKRIAMVRRRWDSQKQISQDDIYLMNADGTNKHWARSAPANFPITQPSWSPDGKRLAVTITIGGKPYLAILELAYGSVAYVLHYDGNKNLIPTPGSNPSYNKAGDEIAYVSDDGKQVQMVRPGSYGDYGISSWGPIVGRPSFSPDGYKIAYSRLIAGTGNSEVFVYRFGTGEKQLTFNGAYDGAPTWSPDGTKLAFVSTRSGRPQIWTMNSSTGGSLTQITKTNSSEVAPAFSH